MKALTTLLAVGMLATTFAMADDSDDVKAAFLNLSLRSERMIRRVWANTTCQTIPILAVGVGCLSGPPLQKKSQGETGTFRYCQHHSPAS